MPTRLAALARVLCKLHLDLAAGILAAGRARPIGEQNSNMT